MTLPNFLIVGGQRCGSTWLYRCLRRHPDVFLPDKKELEFFSYASNDSHDGLVEYMGHFKGAANAKAIGEATPSYFWASNEHGEWLQRPPDFEMNIPSRVRSTLGDEVRLILILRDPVDRAISAFLHHVRMGRLDPGRGLMSAAKQAGIIHMGFYAAHLLRWLADYDLSNFHILIFEEAVLSAQTAFKGVFSHLGVVSRDVSEEDRSPVNVGINVQLASDGIYSLGAGSERPIRILTHRERADLRDLFQPDTECLGAMIDRPDLTRIWS